MFGYSKKSNEVNVISRSKNYHCPRCGNKEIVDYGDSFDCPVCRREFRKADCDRFDDDEVLSDEEKLDMINSWEKRSEYSDSMREFLDD